MAYKNPFLPGLTQTDVLRKPCLLAIAGLLAACGGPAQQTSPPSAAAVPMETARPIPAGRPDLQALAARMGTGGTPPAPEQLAEQKRMVDEQVAYAAGLLGSPDTDQQISGAEQLAAYPTPEAERCLTRYLKAKRGAEPRVAAIRALGYMKAPGREAIGALLTAMTDREPRVRDAALQTLAEYLNRLNPESAPFGRVFGGLKALVRSKRLDEGTRLVVADLLAGFRR